jgi:hypothetical protein
MVMLDEEQQMHKATLLYEKAAASMQMDATERLGIEMARQELAD